MSTVPPARAPVRLRVVGSDASGGAAKATRLLREGLTWARPGAFLVSGDEPCPSHVTSDPVGSGAVLVLDDDARGRVLDTDPGAEGRTLGLADLADALVSVSRTYVWEHLVVDAGAKDVNARWALLPDLLRALGAFPTTVTDVGGQDDRLEAALRAVVYWEARFAR